MCDEEINLIKELKMIDDYFASIRASPEKLKQFEKDLIECGYGKIKPGPLAMTDTIGLSDLWIYKIKVDEESIDELEFNNKEEVINKLTDCLFKHRKNIDELFSKIVIKGCKIIDDEIIFPHLKIIIHYPVKNKKSDEFYEQISSELQGLSNHIIIDVEDKKLNSKLPFENLPQKEFEKKLIKSGFPKE